MITTVLVVLGAGSMTSASTAIVQVGGDIDGQAADERAGTAVAMSADGTRMVVGSPDFVPLATQTYDGRASVLEWDGADWVQVGSDIVGSAPNGSFGRAVAMSADGTRIAIGAPGFVNGSGNGAVHIYELVNNSWTGTSIQGEAAGDRFGATVAMSADGDRIAIGAPDNDGTGSNAGHVRVFDWNGSAWTQVGADIDGEAANDKSGAAAAISGNGTRVVIGATGNDPVVNGSPAFGAGHVRAYDWNGSAWTQVGADIDGSRGNIGFGTAVAISADGTRLAAGEPNNPNSIGAPGTVRVFGLVNSSWTQLGTDIVGEAAGDFAGTSVALTPDGSRIAIGAPYNDGAGVDAGQVRVHDWDGSAWTQVGVDIDGEASNDYSGNAVAISSNGRRMAIGAPLNDGTATDAGHVRVVAIATLADQPTAAGATAGNGQATLSWSAPNDDGGTPITGYMIESSTDGTTWTTEISDTGTPTTSATITGLTNGTAYRFRVAAINPAGTGTVSIATQAATPTGPPATPTGVSATAGNGEATLSWTAPNDDGGAPITGYMIESSTDGTTWTTEITDTGTPATSATITGLTNGTAIEFRVSAINDRGTSAASSPSAQATPAAPATTTTTPTTTTPTTTAPTTTAPTTTANVESTTMAITPEPAVLPATGRTGTTPAVALVLVAGAAMMTVAVRRR